MSITPREKACLSASRRRPCPSEGRDPLESEQGDLLDQASAAQASAAVQGFDHQQFIVPDHHDIDPVPQYVATRRITLLLAARKLAMSRLLQLKGDALKVSVVQRAGPHDKGEDEQSPKDLAPRKQVPCQAHQLGVGAQRHAAKTEDARQTISHAWAYSKQLRSCRALVVMTARSHSPACSNAGDSAGSGIPCRASHDVAGGRTGTTH